MRRNAIPSIATTLGIAATYAFGIRPRLLKWGATEKEVRDPFPGADIVPGGTRGATMAVTIDAPPSRVWPWLAQMGHDRGGWYSWDRLDNFGRRSTERIHPEWQQVAVSDRFIATPDGNMGWEVAAVEPERFLCLRASVDLHGRSFDRHDQWPRFYSDSTWGFLLNKSPGNRTRLVVSGYWHLEPRWLQLPFSIFVLEPAHWIMQMRQFENLKRLAERRGPVRNPNPGNGASPVTAGVTGGNEGAEP